MIFRILVILIGIQLCSGQTALYNAGNIRIHPDGNLGFHTNLINNAPFSENNGLAGFYGDQTLNVSGAIVPFFYDIEIVNTAGVFLNTSVNVENNANFIDGDFQTPRNSSDVFFGFLPDSFYAGANDGSKTDGYAGISGPSTFIFPIGDRQLLRTLRINATSNLAFAKSAYFFEDPNVSGYNTAIKTETLEIISAVEFWKLEGSTLATVTVDWNTRSNMGGIAPDLNFITLVGWNIAQQQWLSLGGASVSGDLNAGTITSAAFVPDDYAAITFGSLAEPTEILVLGNFWLSPNNDGINDILVIPELALSPNNKLEIFDRNGVPVFEQLNYRDEFRGFANTGSWVINPDQGLPAGIYYYTAELYDLELSYQGFLYLER